MMHWCRALTTWGWFLALAALPSCPTRGGEAPDVAFDFESGDLQGWSVVEGKFDRMVADWEFFHNRPTVKFNKQGRYYLNTLELRNKSRTDDLMGVIESPVFLLRGTRVTLLVGGGKHRETYVALCTEDGKEVKQARGRNVETFLPVTWEVPELTGKRVFLRVVDRRKGHWGHITLDDVRAEGEIDAKATAARRAGAERRARQARRRQLVAASHGTLTSLRQAVEHLVETFGPGYPKGKDFLARLAALEGRAKKTSAEELASLEADVQALQRQALLANPLVSGHPIVFVARRQYRGDHHNTATMFQTGEINTRSFTGGGALKLLEFTGETDEAGVPTAKVTTLVDVPQGVARDPEVSFDGKRVLFSMRRDIQDDYHIYEVQVHRGSAPGAADTKPEPRQLTFGAGVSDFDPLYLPDGRIAFSSTREPKYCMCNRHIMGNLFRMDADGANVHQIGRSTLHEGHGTLTPDGRILYDRWEYVDRNFGDAQGVWTCNPDGTNHVLYFGNNTRSPGAMLDSRVIPGSERFIATFSSCHDRPWGALAIVDRRIGMDAKAPVLRTWPPSAIDLVMVGNYDTFKRVKPKYEDPYPLSVGGTAQAAGTTFLCSRQVRGEQMGIFLLDTFGNEVLVHAEAPGCFDPMPLAPRARPVVVPDRINLAKADGSFYIYDVYIGTGMEKVERGTVKAVRVVESPEKRFWSRANWQGSGTQAPGMAWNDFNNKRILGTAPVEPDGSAYFRVPADKFVYFQLLDADGMMVQSMRSGTITRPGERTGCVGCHENRLMGIPNGFKAAYTRPPSVLEPWYGEPRRFNYVTEVQPVFDKHCIRCHDFGKPGTKKVTLAGDLTLGFSVSYMELRRKNLVRVPGAGPANVLMPYSWGSHASPLAQVLRKGHNNVKLDPESFARIVTWIDINAPYYPEYASSYPGNLYGRSPLDGKQLGRLSKLTGLTLGRQSHTPQISLTRPELSPCLSRIANRDSAEYREALAILQAGKAMLAQRPRMDMPGAKLLGVEAEREAKYQRLARLEARSRESLRSGGKFYPEKSEGSSK